jgi:hypothetical protein
MILAMPMIAIKTLIESFRRKGKKGDGDPHDISGEPHIPGGDRP